jgi:hypothetical protein
MAQLTGGCLCGAVRYTAEADQTGAIICHCTDCQKFTGAAFAALVPVQKEALTVTGPVKTHSAVGGSGKPSHPHVLRGMRFVVVRRADHQAGSGNPLRGRA